jgi:hypothetical protein
MRMSIQQQATHGRSHAWLLLAGKRFPDDRLNGR